MVWLAKGWNALNREWGLLAMAVYQRYQFQELTAGLKPSQQPLRITSGIPCRKNTNSKANLPTPIFWHTVLHQ
jgi:hypothetical protein